MADFVIDGTETFLYQSSKASKGRRLNHTKKIFPQGSQQMISSSTSAETQVREWRLVWLGG